MESRRAHDRYIVWFPVSVETTADGDTVAVCKNASQKGLLMAAAAAFEPGSPVTVSFQVLPVDREARVVHGTVVRTQENARDPFGVWRYEMAVEFDEPIPELEALLHAATVRPKGES